MSIQLPEIDPFHKALICAQAHERGEFLGQLLALLQVLRVRGFDVSNKLEALMESCDNAELLRIWIERAVTATTLDDVFVLPRE
ncbi:hypothetical protein G3I76_24415 [Streptomyces sp. SID11233]|uniref:hypothetical protein n=1 Tax=Streptomyces sp. SID11385 TaxID=2706031 RepID=UPI0013C238B2|nr:hypothetical protein [Streptomyces sp. SID11385]NEA39986.1 hypothetical protein [Streptomyces sp. SID11385]NED83220.1 hypothetical protein [Streptomyces sp. SID11233]